MTSQQVRIMFYDTTQKQWVVDTMEVTSENMNENQSDEGNEGSMDTSSEN